MCNKSIDPTLMPGYREGYSVGVRDGSEAGMKIAQEAYINSVKPIHIACTKLHCPVHAKFKAEIVEEIMNWVTENAEEVIDSGHFTDSMISESSLIQKLKEMAAE